MAFAWSIACAECSLRQLAGLEAHAIHYWLGEDHFTPMPYSGAWCEVCQKVTLGEEVPDAATLEERGERQLRLLGGRDVSEDFYNRKRRQLVWQLEWRSQRSAPRQCLLCRSTSISLLDLSGQPPLSFPHPGCQGQLRFKETDWHYHTRVMWIYSIEGAFLGFGSGFEGFTPPPVPCRLRSQVYPGGWISKTGNRLSGRDAFPPSVLG